MEIQITRHGINLGENQVDYLQQKIDNAIRSGGRMDNEATSAQASVRLVKNKSGDNVVVEITIFTKGAVIRAEEQALSFEAAVDLSEEKLKKQLLRYKERYKKRRREEIWIPSGDLAEDTPADEPQITKRKQFTNSKEIHEEEAIELMELAGHDFFLFNNIDTKRWAVVYKRKEGSYGLIESKFENQ